MFGVFLGGLLGLTGLGGFRFGGLLAGLLGFGLALLLLFGRLAGLLVGGALGFLDQLGRERDRGGLHLVGTHLLAQLGGRQGRLAS